MQGLFFKAENAPEFFSKNHLHFSKMYAILLKRTKKENVKARNF